MLGVARNVPATLRLLDALELLRGDRRIQVEFTTTSSVAFPDGDSAVLSAAGARVLGWAEATERRFDLAVSASANGPLHRLRAPLLVLPHGAGQHKLIDPADVGRGVHGVAAEQLMLDGRVVPDLLLLTGDESMRILNRDCPPAAKRARVAGDLAHQQLLDARRERARYRSALGIADHLRLVTVSSTWGPWSLLGSRPNLLEELLSGLPRDEYRVAAVLHPNIVARHSEYQIRSWLRDALDAGLLLIPGPSWQAALSAADVVVGDHGSVTFYAAALDLPVLLAATGAGETPEDSAVTVLAGRAPVWRQGVPPAEQIEAAIAASRQAPLAGITTAALALGVDAAAAYRSAMYELMKLSEPAWPAILTPPALPRVESTPVTAHDVETEVDGDRVRLRRFPSAVAGAATAADRGPWHVAVDVREPDPRIRESAAVVLDADPPGGRPAADHARWLLSVYPACRVAAVATGQQDALMALRDGRVVAVHFSGADSLAAASAIHALAARGGKLPALVLADVGAAVVEIAVG